MTKDKLAEFNKELNDLLKKYHCILVPDLKVQDLPTVNLDTVKEEAPK